MKKFSEIKEGDLIYYWDHCQLHAQRVNSIENTIETKEHTDWVGNKWTDKYEWTIINAGKSKYPLQLNQFRRKESSIIYGMRRFADLEAAREWIISLCTSATNRRNKYKRAFERTNKVVSKYHNILQYFNNI